MKYYVFILTLFLLGCAVQVSETTGVEPFEEIQVEETIPEEETQSEEPIVEEPAPDVVESTPVEELEEVESEKSEPKVELPVEPKTILINGKTVEERLKEAYSQLHREGSSDHVREHFPDITLVFEENPEDFPPEILPFEYYYSEEADVTFNLCAVHRTVFICEGKLERAATPEELDSDKCRVTPEYTEYK